MITWDHDYSLVENSVLVPTNAVTPISDSATTDKGNTDFTIRKRESLSTASKTKATGSSVIKEAIQNREVPQEIEKIITGL